MKIAQVPFTPVPNEVLEDGSLIPSAKCLYLIILKHTGQNGAAWPSRKTLAKQLGLKTTKQVTNLVNLLRDRSLILIDPHTEPYGTNTYIPLVTIEGKQTSAYTGNIFQSYSGNLLPTNNKRNNKSEKKDKFLSIAEIVNKNYFTLPVD